MNKLGKDEAKLLQLEGKTISKVFLDVFRGDVEGIFLEFDDGTHVFLRGRGDTIMETVVVDWNTKAAEKFGQHANFTKSQIFD